MEHIKQVIRKKHVVVAIACVCVLAVIAVFACGEKSDYESLDYDKYIKVCNYEKMKPAQKSQKVEDKDVQKEIKKRLHRDSKVERKEYGTVKDGDEVLISYYAEVDGSMLQGGSQQDQVVKVGSGSMPKEFEEAVVGKKVGDRFTVKHKLPDDYIDQSMVGRVAKYEVAVNAILERDIPKYDIAYVKSKGYDSQADYEKAIRKELEKKSRLEASNESKDEIWGRVVSGSTVIKYPDDLVKKEAENRLALFKAHSEVHGIPWDKYVENYLKTDEKTLASQIKANAKDTVKEKMVAYAIAKQKNIRFSGEEYKGYLNQQDSDSIESEYGISFEKYEKTADMYSQFVIDRVKDNLAGNQEE